MSSKMLNPDRPDGYWARFDKKKHYLNIFVKNSFIRTHDQKLIWAMFTNLVCRGTI